MYMTFADRLRELRGKRTQKEIAQALGAKQSNYQSWENGREPSYDMLRKIAAFHGVTVDYLLGASDRKLPDSESFCEQFGLTENALLGLRVIRNSSTDDYNLISILNYILEDEYERFKSEAPNPGLRDLLYLILISPNEIDKLCNRLNISKQHNPDLTPIFYKLLNYAKEGFDKKIATTATAIIEEWRRSYHYIL